jgi:hypothetical protein
MQAIYKNFVFCVLESKQGHSFPHSSGIWYRFIIFVSLSAMLQHGPLASEEVFLYGDTIPVLIIISCWCKVQFHNKSSEKVQCLFLNMKKKHIYTHPYRKYFFVFFFTELDSDLV